MVILLVSFEMLGKVVYPLCEECDLNFGRACVALVSSILFDDSILFFPPL